jgi:phenylalanyl-tRNA synthetase alpha chain
LYYRFWNLFLNSGSWKTQTFKQYNFNATGIPPQGGHLHPLMKVREEFRHIFFEMGYAFLDSLDN